MHYGERPDMMGFHEPLSSAVHRGESPFWGLPAAKLPIRDRKPGIKFPRREAHLPA